MKQETEIFKKGSITFFTSSLLFPKEIKRDVYDLYSFVRVADDYVDQVPADKVSFLNLRKLYETSSIDKNFDVQKNSQDDTNLTVVKNIIRLSRKRNFDKDWIIAFLDAMQSDLNPKQPQTLEDTLNYVYGSAEVIGLMMARIMQLPKQAEAAARKQGRAMQFINFIRDVNEDNALGRIYFPEQDLNRFGLTDLSEKAAETEHFNEFIQFEIERYKVWQHEAEQGYKYIPKGYLAPIKTAAEMYNWTAQQILANPKIIFETKVKPSKARLMRRLLRNKLSPRQF